MKIAIVIEKFLPTAGGNERSTLQIASQLIQRGHTVTVITNRCDSDQSLLPGGTIISAGGLSTKYALGLWLFIRWAKRELERGDFDLSLSMTTAVPATLIQLRSGTVRETLLRNLAMRTSPLKRFAKQLAMLCNLKRWALLAAERKTLVHPSVKKIVAISQYVVDQLFHHYTISSRRVALIPNAAEVQQFDADQQADIRQQMRSKLRLESDDVVFLFAATNPALKGLGYLLEAMTILLKQHANAKLIVAGTLDYNPQRHAQRLGIRDAVRWVGPTRCIDQLYIAADVTVLPSWYDPSSKVVLESLLHGVPAISTLHNGASQWIYSPSGETTIPSPFEPMNDTIVQCDEQPAGRVVRSPNDVEALAEAMAQLCDSNERAGCAAATDGLAGHLTMTRHVDQLELLMRKVVEKTKGLL